MFEARRIHLRSLLIRGLGLFLRLMCRCLNTRMFEVRRIHWNSLLIRGLALFLQNWWTTMVLRARLREARPECDSAHHRWQLAPGNYTFAQAETPLLLPGMAGGRIANYWKEEH